MGNSRSTSRHSQRSLQNFIADPNFRANSQNIYANNTNAASYPGADHDNHSLALSRKNIPMTTQSTLAIKNDFLVEKNSVHLVPTDHPGVFYLTFKFSSMTDVEVSIFYHGKDMIDDQQNTQYIFVDTKKYPPVKSFIFGPVRDQEFPALASTLDSKLYTKENLTKTTDGFYPLIIKMETKNDRVDLPRKILYTYFSFKSHNKKYEGKFIKQKLEVNKVSYILDDIYGIADSDVAGTSSQEGKECTICMTNKVDTIVLPCKHMCLCLNCAKDLRDRRDSKCPMCRTTVENYLILKKS